jgi:hypothetical protein
LKTFSSTLLCQVHRLIKKSIIWQLHPLDLKKKKKIVNLNILKIPTLKAPFFSLLGQQYFVKCIVPWKVLLSFESHLVKQNEKDNNKIPNFLNFSIFKLFLETPTASTRSRLLCKVHRLIKKSIIWQVHPLDQII